MSFLPVTIEFQALGLGLSWVASHPSQALGEWKEECDEESGLHDRRPLCGGVLLRIRCPQAEVAGEAGRRVGGGDPPAVDGEPLPRRRRPVGGGSWIRCGAE